MKRPTLFLLLVLSASSQLSMDALQAAAQIAPTPASHRANLTEADKRDLLTKARTGDCQAQFWLGTAYEQGFFGGTNFRKARKWFKKAADHGDADAQNALGQMYEGGEGVSQDYTMAAKWYRKAAQHVPNLGGAGQGRNNLGLLYLNGRGVPKDFVRAYVWFRLANTETNLAAARSQMSAAQVEEAEGMAAEWKLHHPQP